MTSTTSSRREASGLSRTRLLHSLVSTDATWAPTIARLGLGAVMFPHGAQKLLGWYGGYGFNGTMGFFTQTMGIPWVLAFGVILVEFFGALALIAGIGVRVAALAIGVVMATAMMMVHWQHGFFMNWFGNQKGEGIEFFLLAITLAAVGVLQGGGALSVDRALSERQ